VVVLLLMLLVVHVVVLQRIVHLAVLPCYDLLHSRARRAESVLPSTIHPPPPAGASGAPHCKWSQRRCTSLAILAAGRG